MRRRTGLVLAAVLLLGLCACGRAVVEESAPFTAPTAAAQTEAVREPALSPGAAEAAYRASRFQMGPDGTLYTSLTRAEGLVCLYDVLPADIGYIARFRITEDGIYAALRSEYFSLEPSALYLFPEDGGEARLLVEELSAAGDFMMTDDAIFYLDYDNETLQRLDLASGESEPVMPDVVRLLDSDGGFIYYAKSDGVYRNDSTMGAETLLFSPAESYVFAQDGRIADLAYREDGAHIELRGMSGALLTDIRLDELTDNFLCAGGIAYVPQPSAREVRMLDLQTGETRGRIPLPSLSSYCTLLYAAGETVYYQTYTDAETLFRADRNGETLLGSLLL